MSRTYGALDVAFNNAGTFAPLAPIVDALCSDAASLVTATTLMIDGGLTAA